MAGSTPADLAVTFRSIDRRLREALDGEPPNDAAAAPVAELDHLVTTVAQDVGAAAGGTLRERGDAIAAAIEKVPADRWDPSQLERLRSAALEAGRLLRTIAELTDKDS
jgi:hypothetical protein